ncbi:hypothetical protein J6590_051210 [Homalodisca vitripennis]|nr:hypothetical protein J6590_051210 [Homalodisca vitripennis]
MASLINTWHESCMSSSQRDEVARFGPTSWHQLLSLFSSIWLFEIISPDSLDFVARSSIDMIPSSGPSRLPWPQSPKLISYECEEKEGVKEIAFPSNNAQSTIDTLGVKVDGIRLCHTIDRCHVTDIAFRYEVTEGVKEIVFTSNNVQSTIDTLGVKVDGIRLCHTIDRCHVTDIAFRYEVTEGVKEIVFTNINMQSAIQLVSKQTGLGRVTLLTDVTKHH